ncbi:MAG: PIN domain-containing protein [Candidatus Njordarchaeales archaeon]
MEIVDTVYLVAYFRPSDNLHDDAIRIIESLDEEKKISEAALIEFDLLMKSRGFRPIERIQTWKFLDKLINHDFVELVTPIDMAVATYLLEKYDVEYFDSIIAAQCILREARPLTTDDDIIRVVSMFERIIKELRDLDIALAGSRG